MLGAGVLEFIINIFWKVEQNFYELIYFFFCTLSIYNAFLLLVTIMENLRTHEMLILTEFLFYFILS